MTSPAETGSREKKALRFATPKKLYVLLKNPDDTDSLTKFKAACEKHPGTSEVILVLTDTGTKRAMRMPFRCDLETNLVDTVTSIFGADAVTTK